MFSQKVKKVEGEYTLQTETLSPAEAKRVALERAMLEAIAKEFGTLVSEHSHTITIDNSKTSQSDFYSIGGSEVKGEWVRTIGDPEYTITYDNNMLVVTAKVKGEAREIETATIKLDVRPLKNSPDLKFESQEFKNNDDFFLYFQSPENGFLSVFLLDETTAGVSMLLPYETSDMSSYPIKRGQKYIFFSDKTCEKSELETVESYTLMCEGDVEYNSIYAVFSPNKFSSPLSDKRRLDVPVITYEEFNKWLVNNRKHDKEMNVQTITVKISK